jgi:hypothetical protein
MRPSIPNAAGAGRNSVNVSPTSSWRSIDSTTSDPIDGAVAANKPWPRGAISLLQKCWCQEPENRPSFKYVIQKLEALEGTFSKHGRRKRQGKAGASKTTGQEKGPSEGNIGACGGGCGGGHGGGGGGRVGGSIVLAEPSQTTPVSKVKFSSQSPSPQQSEETTRHTFS